MPELPDQPDGIQDDSRDLPNPVRAAERVREYICASGDGLYDIQGGAPLYARDLEAITRAVRDRATALDPAQPLPVADGSEVQACVFCAIIAGDVPATVVRKWPDAIAIVPLKPIVAGHLLVIPTVHVADFTTASYVSAMTMHRASELAAELDQEMNLITSKGQAATQSVFHLHLHLVPRAEDDGLALPWYSGRRRRPPRREPPTPAAWPSIPEGDGRG